MSKESIPSEKDIELHHPAIEEIMGAPPASMVAVGSGVIFLLLLGLLIGSFFFTYTEEVHATAILHGDKPLEVLIAPVSGRVDIFGLSGEMVRSNDTIFELHETQTKNIFSITTLSSGLLEINPLLAIQKNAQQHDTIGFIWDTEPSPTICSISLSPEQMKNVKIENMIRIHMTRNMADCPETIEIHVQSLNTFNRDNMTQVIAMLPIDSLQNRTLRGDLHVTAEIIVGEQTFFQRLINPFRGLIK